MNRPFDPKNRRRIRNYFIKKGLQTDFILKFCLLVILACLISSIIIYSLSKKTTITSFENLRLTVRSTADFLFPVLVISSVSAIAIVCASAVIMFLVITHRIAGPIHRFEMDLTEVGRGDLTKNIHLRKKDEFKTLAATLNTVIKNFRDRLHLTQTSLNQLDSDMCAVKDALMEKGIPEDDIEHIIKPAKKKIEQAKHALSFFKLSSIIFVFSFISCFACGLMGFQSAHANVTDGIPPAELVSNDGWLITRGVFCTIYFRDDVDVKMVNDRLDTYRIDYGLLEKPPKPGESSEEKIAYKLDLIFYKAQELLDMRPEEMCLNVRIYRGQDDLDRIYMEIFDKENEFISFYVFKINTLFSSQSNISANIAAHEIAHCIVDHYFSVVPPKKVAEMIAQYVDANLRE